MASVDMQSIVDEIVTTAKEDYDRFIFETVQPYCEEVAKMEIKKADLEEALTVWQSYKSGAFERKTGKWVHGREIWREHIGDAVIAIGYENWRCGECGVLVKDEASKVLWKYCPWCGARMEDG